MKENISRVLNMMEEGTIDSERAAELIDLMKANETEEAPSQNNKTNRTLKIRVHSEDKENVNVNLPLGIVRTLLKTGQGIAASVPQAEQFMEDVDLNVLMDAIDNDLTGEIVNVDTENEAVRIYIE